MLVRATKLRDANERLIETLRTFIAQAGHAVCDHSDSHFVPFHRLLFRLTGWCPLFS
jgi:hypothetical protein